MRIAIIGGGISGLSAAWLLRDEHSVTVFECNTELGGHAHTEVVAIDGQKIPVDTAFVVFNKRHYPNLVAFFEALQVPVNWVYMALAISLDNGNFEWSTRIPNGIFADRRNILRLSFWRLLSEVVRFNKVARTALSKLSAEETLGAWLDRNHFSERFRTHYLYPITGAVWSTPGAGVETSPAKSVLQFLYNHGTLQVSEKNRLDWYTVQGGSREYVQTVAQALIKHGHTVRTNTVVQKVARRKDGVEVITKEGHDQFDYVIFATHADTTLSLLDRPTSDEKRLLTPFAYERNEVYLHSDTSFMPRRKRAWGTWVYAGEPEEPDGTRKASITYNMNDLQKIDPKYPMYVTLNPAVVPEKAKVYQHYTYHHPIYSSSAIRAQGELQMLQDKQRSLFCGSYFGWGFHEDGISSAITAVKYLGVTPPWER